MRIKHFVLLTSFLLGVACAEGETLKSSDHPDGGGGGTAGTGGGTVGAGGDPVGTGGTPGVCELQTSDAICNDCLNTTCLNSCNACATNQACTDLLDCIQDCTDATCENTCLGQFPTGEASFNAFVGETGCMVVDCATECGTTGCGLTSSIAACDECINTSCYSECVACSDTPDCLDLLDCISACSDATCDDACIATYPNGLDPLTNLLGTDGCMDVMCATECG
jgi:hypothetical protein